MTRVLVATASVHTTAAACDYLVGRLGANDKVIVLTVTEPNMAARDAGDAANVARTRLVEPTVEALTRDGEPTTVIQEVATERDVDEIVIGPHGGDPERASDPPGSTARVLLGSTGRPIVVVPV